MEGGGVSWIFNFGIWYVTSLWGKNAKVRVLELNLCLKHNMVFSFGIVLFKFSFYFFLMFLYLGFIIFQDDFFSFYIYFYIYH
jgi:hypothetical protein